MVDLRAPCLTGHPSVFPCLGLLAVSPCDPWLRKVQPNTGSQEFEASAPCPPCGDESHLPQAPRGPGQSPPQETGSICSLLRREKRLSDQPQGKRPGVKQGLGSARLCPAAEIDLNFLCRTTFYGNHLPSTQVQYLRAAGPVAGTNVSAPPVAECQRRGCWDPILGWSARQASERNCSSSILEVIGVKKTTQVEAEMQWHA